LQRLDRVVLGNFGDYKSVGDGVLELRFKFGAGYRVYYALIGTTVILLLVGGDQSSQSKDIKEAQKLWSQYQEYLQQTENE
jgi:putative addiction module killer protein